MSALGGIIQLKNIAIEERPMGRLHWSATPAKETGYASVFYGYCSQYNFLHKYNTKLYNRVKEME